jgi:hypothetical protein
MGAAGAEYPAAASVAPVWAGSEHTPDNKRKKKERLTDPPREVDFNQSDGETVRIVEHTIVNCSTSRSGLCRTGRVLPLPPLLAYNGILNSRPAGLVISEESPELL